MPLGLCHHSKQNQQLTSAVPSRVTNLVTRGRYPSHTLCRSHWLATAASGGLHEPLAEAVDERAVGRRQIVDEAVERLDNDAPLRESRDRAERVEARLEFMRQTYAELRIVADLLSVGAGGRPACTTT